MEEKSPGLLLQSIPYLGQQKILKVLTPEQGLLSLLCKSSRHPTTPFCIAEWVYRKTQREIYPLIDATLLDSLDPLKESYEVLSAAGSIARDLLQTQLPHKKASELYSLTCAYLKKLPQNPPLLAASFRLKLLLHEGLLSPEPDPLFTPEEWEQIAILAFTRQFSRLQEVTAVPYAKIGLLFEERMG